MENISSIERCNALIQRDEAVISKCSHLTYFPLVVEKCYGATIEDVDGNQYIDFLSSASSLNLGSSHPIVTAAIEKQLAKCTQYSAAYSYNEPMIRYAEKLVSVYPGKVNAKVCFGNCGSDANDAAVKFARAYTGRSKIITFINGYHGATYGSASLTTVTTRMRKKMGPFLPEVYSFPFSNCHHCPYGKCKECCHAECLEPLETALSTYIPADEVAAVIIEPLQGDGGIIPANPIFMNKLYQLCKGNGILFFSEEVQQAFGRTGKWFSIEHYDIVPDGIIMGKSVGGGLTLGAFMARSEIINCLDAPAHLFTLGGNSIACTAGSTAFDLLAKAGFFDEVTRKGHYIKTCFLELGKKYGIVGDVRGLGMSIGVEIVKDTTSMERDVIGTTKICYRSYEKGLIMISLAGNVLRVQPPLVITYDEIDKAITIIDEAMAEYKAGAIPDEVLNNCTGW